jgi:hypothetical protein
LAPLETDDKVEIPQNFATVIRGIRRQAGMLGSSSANFRVVCLSILVCLVGALGLAAAELRRGPFLQLATPKSITIRWRTDVPCPSVVFYGTRSNYLPSFVTDLKPTIDHEIRISGLTPATRYFYSVGSTIHTLAEGPDCHFITHPVPGVTTPTRVWVIGDPGQSPDDGQVLVRDAYYQYAGTRRTDVWLTLGDNAYFFMDDAEYQTSFFDVYRGLFRQTAIWATIGNHEIWSVPPGERIPYLDIFSFPTNGEAGGIASGAEEYYSFDYANIHFISLDSMTTSRAADGPMANWLRADLTATTGEWIIAFWHHPPYSKGAHDSDDPWEYEMVEMRENIVPILEAGGVDLVLNGHCHTYERSYLLRGHYGDSKTFRPEMILDQGSGRENDSGPYIKAPCRLLPNQGTVYVEVGCSGSIDTPNGHHPAMFLDKQRRGSLVLDISSNRVDVIFLNETGTIDDSFTMVKGNPESFRVFGLTLTNGKISLRWKSTCGQSYQIERSESGHLLDWRPASDPITAVGATTSWSGIVSPGSMSFYRAAQLPLPGKFKRTPVSGNAGALEKPP